MIEAGQLLVERAGKHGDFTIGAQFTQDVMDELMDTPCWHSLAAFHKEGAHMIVHKLQRVMTGQHDYDDHWLDIEGYARCVRERLHLFDSAVIGKMVTPKVTDLRIAVASVLLRQPNYDEMRVDHRDSVQIILTSLVTYITGQDLTDGPWLTIEKEAREVYTDIRSRA